MIHFVEEITDYFTIFEKVVRINDVENVLFKRMSDGTVVVSHEDHLTCTLTKLAYFRDGRWTGYNSRNLEKMFTLFRTHRNLKPAFKRFLTPDSKSIFKVDKYFTCAKKRFHISLKKVAKAVHLSHSDKS